MTESRQPPHSRTLYPVNLDVSGRLCLVVGGGAVAARKIASLLRCNARVRVVSPEVCGKIRQEAEAGALEWLPRPYRDDDLHGVFLVFAATNDPGVQLSVARQAARSGVLLNSVDRPEDSDFHVPAKIRRGDLLISVSTGGASPALSTVVKRKLAEQFGPEYGLLVGLMSLIRKQIVGSGSASEENRVLFHRVLEQPVLECIQERNWDRLRGILVPLLPSKIDCDALLAELRDG